MPRRRPAPKPRTTAASFADKYDLYQRAVQCVEAEIDFVDRQYRRIRGKPASLLREDFCGAAATSCEWARRRPTNIAVGLDIDQVPMDWGVKNNLSKLKEPQRARVILKNHDVLQAGPETSPDQKGFDAILAMNFSYWCFRDRATLLRYFTAVRRSLKPDGMFFMDFYGGYDSMKVLEEPRRIPARPGGGYGSPPFTYVWEHHSYDPITSHITCFIHFRFADGSEKKRAFRYDWRLWSIPEVREVLAEAGFNKSTVYWEGDDGKGAGNGIFRPATRGEPCASFISYLTAENG